MWAMLLHEVYFNEDRNLLGYPGKLYLFIYCLNVMVLCNVTPCSLVGGTKVS
jgi:hypothetical protein